MRPAASPFRAGRPRLRTALGAMVLAVVTAVAGLSGPAYAAGSGQVVTPGDFTGYGFDQCLAPSQRAMNVWWRNSPFWAVGIYISGASRGCRSQPNLTPAWVRTQLAHGWRLLPITLGPQASCSPHFPRYGNDPVIIAKPGKSGHYAKARRQGRAEADTTVAEATRLGIGEGSTLWYDLEGFDSSKKDCRESATAFLSGWTQRLHRHDYVSGVYSSAGSGIKMLDDARVAGRTDVTLPDRIWIARWDGVANTSTSYIRNGGWRPGGRMKQYQGGHNETWGGVTINIDRNWLDLGRGSVADPEEHCGGVAVDFTAYRPLATGSTNAAQVRALKCLLTEQGAFSGKPGPRYGARLGTAVSAWRTAHGLPAGADWTRAAWLTLLSAGETPVVKFGSAGPDVRRIQRALNASRVSELSISGVVDSATGSAIRKWQSRAGFAATGIVTGKMWHRLQRGQA